MKKIFSLAVFVLSFGVLFTGCTDDDTPVYMEGDGNTIAEVFEINRSFAYNSNSGWIIKDILNPAIRTSDNLLIYRLSDFTPDGKDVWQLIPRTLYLGDVNSDGYDDELDYDYDFSVVDFMIYAKGTYNLSITPQYINDQIFRVVIIPGSFNPTNKTVTPPVDYRDYNAVVKYFKIDESKIIRK